MKEYNINEISKALEKNPETIRRLIRNEQLVATTLGADKIGYRITEESLKAFLTKYPKYMTTAASNLLSGSAVPIALTSVITAVVTSTVVRKNRHKVTAERVEETIKKQLRKNEKAVEESMLKISKLESELKKVNANLEDARKQVATYQQALDELDFNEIANSINKTVKESKNDY